MSVHMSVRSVPGHDRTRGTVAVLIDTSVLVAAERGHLELQRLVQPEEEYVLSVVSAAELLHGVHRASGERGQRRAAYVETLLATFLPLPVDITVARAYAYASAALAAKRMRVDANDLWIGHRNRQRPGRARPGRRLRPHPRSHPRAGELNQGAAALSA